MINYVNKYHPFVERMKIILELTGCFLCSAILNKIVDIKDVWIRVILSSGNFDISRLYNYI